MRARVGVACSGTLMWSWPRAAPTRSRIRWRVQFLSKKVSASPILAQRPTSRLSRTSSAVASSFRARSPRAPLSARLHASGGLCGVTRMRGGARRHRGHCRRRHLPHRPLLLVLPPEAGCRPACVRARLCFPSHERARPHAYTRTHTRTHIKTHTPRASPSFSSKPLVRAQLR